MMKHVDIPVRFAEIIPLIAATLSLPQLVYMWGHPLEVVNTLQEYTNDRVKQDQKFPLVALFTDIPIRRHFPSAGFFGQARLHVIIANITKPHHKAQERLEINFQPILQPIKEALVTELGRHSQWTYPDDLRYEEIERYYWGKQGLPYTGNTANVFNDYIDCIELRDINLNIYKNKC